MREYWESAGNRMCSQEPVGVAGRGATGVCVGMLGREATGVRVGMARTVGTGNVWVFQGWWTCQSCWALGVVRYTGPADTEMCGYAERLAVSGSPIRRWEGGKGTAVWEMYGIHLVR